MHGNRTLIIIAYRLTTIKNCDRIYKVENHKTYEITEKACRLHKKGDRLCCNDRL